MFYPLDPVSVKREVEWAIALLKYHQKEISLYIELLGKFEKAILQDRLEEADSLLDSIGNNLGPSNWWIKQKIGFLQYYKGLEAQKQFSSDIKSQFSSSSVQAYIIHQISIRNEPSVTPSKMLKQLVDDIEASSIDEEYKHKIYYHVSGDMDESVAAALNVLRFSSAESIVDVFEAVINLFRNFAIDGNREYIILGVKAGECLSTLFDDDRITNLLRTFSKLSSGFQTNTVTEKHEDSEKQYIVGEDISGVSSTMILENALLDDFDDTSPSLSDKLSKYVNAVISKNIHTESYSVELDRITLAFSSFSVFNDLRAVLVAELNPEYRYHPNLLSDAQQRDYEKIRRRNTFLLCTSSFQSRLWHLYLPTDLILDGHNYSIPQLHSGILKSVESPYSALFEAIRQLNKGEASTTLLATKNLWQASSSACFRAIGLKFYILSLVSSGNFAEAICVLTSEYVKNPSVRYLVSVRDLTDSIDRGMRKQLAGQLAIPLMFDIYARHVDGAYVSTLKRSVAEVLIKSKIGKPSLMMSTGHKFSSESFIYFLRYCCIPENIYTTGFFPNSTSLIEERIAVLRQLIILDSKNKEVYDGEIYERTRRVVLDARRAEVEQSKIELDTEGFLRTAEKRVKESYQRYLAYASIEISNQIAEKPSLSDSGQPVLPPIPEKEDQSLFYNIIKDLREIFLYDKYFGLDGVIGTRIRHNVLESELRSPLVATNLITSRDADGNYHPNLHWLQDIIYIDEELTLELSAIFSEFSNHYDSLLLEIKNEWVQIKGQSHENGLIEFGSSLNKFSVMEELAKESRLPFNIFAEETFNIFVNLLEPSLALLRDKLEKVGKARALELLDGLEKNLRNKYTLPEGLIDEILNARTAVLRAFDRVKEWFRPTYENSSEPIKFEDVIQIGVEIIQRYHPSFKSNIVLGETSEALIPGYGVRGFTDMLIILFDNAIRRSEISPSPMVNVSAEYAGPNLRITVSNQFGRSIDLADLRTKTEAILLNIANRSYKELLKGDRGTGIYRLYDAIANVVKIEPEIEIAVTDNRMFTISFNLLNTQKL